MKYVTDVFTYLSVLCSFRKFNCRGFGPTQAVARSLDVGNCDQQDTLV